MNEKPARKLRVFTSIYSDEQGVVALITALVISVFIVLGLGSLDLYKVYNSRQSMQFIVDSAAYSAMKDIASVDPEVAGKEYVKELFQEEKFAQVSSPIKLSKVKSELNSNRSILTVEAEVKVPTPFMEMINIPNFTYKVQSQAEYKCRPYDATYLGNAYLNSDDEYVVTPDNFNQKGWVWVNNRFDLTKTQSISLRFFFGNKNQNGADGMTFAIQNDVSGLNAQGWHGEALGVAWHPYWGYPKNENTIVAPSVVVEFDTWYNGGEADPRLDHTAIFSLGNKQKKYNSDNVYLHHRRANQIMPYKTLGNIEDNRYHYVRFIWDADKKKLIYFFDGKKMHEKRFDLVRFLGSSDAIFGFTASTGGARNEHKVCFARANIL